MTLFKWSMVAASFAALNAVGGCAFLNDDRPVATESRPLSAKELENWTDRQWRRDKSAQWSRDDERLSRLRLQEFVQ